MGFGRQFFSDVQLVALVIGYENVRQSHLKKLKRLVSRRDTGIDLSHQS